MQTQTSSRTALAALVMLLTPLLFSTNLVFGRMVVADVSPFLLAFIRWGLVAALLAPFAWPQRAAIAALLRDHWRLVLLLGFLGMWICGAGVYVAIGHTTATNGTLIYTSSSVLILLIEAAMRGRRIAPRELLGSVVAIAGIVAIVLKGDLGALARLDFNVGDLIFVAAAVSWAFYSVLLRSSGLRGLSNVSLFAVVAAAGALVIAPFALAEAALGGVLPTTAGAWRGIGGIVLFSSLGAFLGFQFGVRVLGASLAGIFMYLMPPFGVGLAVLLLGESFQPYHAAGIALVLGGVVLATLPTGWLRHG